MVLCIVVGCSKRSGRDKDISFYRLPKVISNKGSSILELSKKRRAGYVAAIARSDLTEKSMAYDRVCSRHFINGKPAPLEDESIPDWLPTRNLGHCKVLGNPVQIAERWIRRKAREDARSDTNEDVLVSSMSSTTAASSRDKAVEGLLALTSSSFSANGGNIVEDGDESIYNNGVQLTDVGDDQVTCEAAYQSSNSASSSSDVSVQTDMSCTLVGLEINKKCLSLLDIFSVDWDDAKRAPFLL